MKKIVTIIMLLALLAGITPESSVVSAKSTSKVVKVFTLTQKKDVVHHRLSINPKEKVKVKIDILDVKGRLKGKEHYFGYYEFVGKNTGGKGSFLSSYSTPKLKKNLLKKGKSLSPADSDGNVWISAKAYVDWELPNGIKKLKVRVTYYTKSGRKGIKSCKVKK